jgi:hypothetical protein
VSLYYIILYFTINYTYIETKSNLFIYLLSQAIGILLPILILILIKILIKVKKANRVFPCASLYVVGPR